MEGKGGDARQGQMMEEFGSALQRVVLLRQSWKTFSTETVHVKIISIIYLQPYVVSRGSSPLTPQRFA